MLLDDNNVYSTVLPFDFMKKVQQKTCFINYPQSCHLLFLFSIHRVKECVMDFKTNGVFSLSKGML